MCAISAAIMCTGEAVKERYMGVASFLTIKNVCSASTLSLMGTHSWIKSMRQECLSLNTVLDYQTEMWDWNSILAPGPS